MKFNISDDVKVKLTDYGRRVLKEAHNELINKYNISKDSPVYEYIPPEEDNEGWSRWQLWHLMEKFGDVIYLGAVLPFEPTIDICTVGEHDG